MLPLGIELVISQILFSLYSTFSHLVAAVSPRAAAASGGAGRSPRSCTTRRIRRSGSDAAWLSLYQRGVKVSINRKKKVEHLHFLTSKYINLSDLVSTHKVAKQLYSFSNQ